MIQCAIQSNQRGSTSKSVVSGEGGATLKTAAPARPMTMRHVRTTGGLTSGPTHESSRWKSHLSAKSCLTRRRRDPSPLCRQARKGARCAISQPGERLMYSSHPDVCGCLVERSPESRFDHSAETFSSSRWKTLRFWYRAQNRTFCGELYAGAENSDNGRRSGSE